ncbi:LIM domain kinase 1 isoform X2 [Pectinophora gossypiella]|uniref:LIM domain kinase 1 isoform X2 n=1 Tax=Pectinophora gossypiella TaxID=13191 RepID=UPI00214DFC1A|nr:LIM domain kinase 1 isoform X2 [Pectinophora gossypiella]
MEGPNSKGSLSCAGCLNDIGAAEYVSALGQDWHKDCFRCSVCDAALSSWYFEKAGLLFCQADYWARYGESCQQCGQVITGPVMSAGEHRFHPECFACVACAAHIEDGEPYALVERSNLYCGGCYSATPGGAVRRPHAIRVLDVPASALTLQPAHGGALTVTQIDSACGLLTLHIGDRILEINGSPVKNRTLDEIERTLARPDAVIQLTIEHNSETANNNTLTKRTPCTPDEDRPNNNINNTPKLDSKSPVERKILKEEKRHIPNKHSEDADIPKEEDRERVKKERLFKRKGDEGVKVRVIKRRQTPSSPLLGDKERSSSMSKLLDVVDGEEPSGVLCDLSRARSFRAEPAPGQKVFRACDLLQGELLGSGFFGQVYKVTHRETGEVMVLKQLYRVDEDAQRNFIKEVAVLRSLKHPNVLRFIGVLYKDKRLHLVTEYVAGGTLHQLLQESCTPLSVWRRAQLARDVARGLGYLHRMNVIHRDLNSHNCLVREDLTVIVADFGLARIVQRTASNTLERPRNAHSTLRRKRYTVVGNPYWMAPEMMNGNVYDEKVDVFSFGIILCEIIGRVSADPDFLPRRADFGLNESVFVDKFCSNCPEPFYRVAFLACHLDPDRRPPFEVLEIWLESLVMHLSNPGPLPPNLLADILQYAHGATEKGHATPECCQHQDNNIFCASDTAGECCLCKKCGSCEKLRRSPSRVASVELNLPEGGVIKSKSNAMIDTRLSPGRALGKCVSASAISVSRPVVTLTNLSRSQHALTPGFILRQDGYNINITKVDDITEWLEPPPPLKRTSPDANLNTIATEPTFKTRKVDDQPDNLPSFLRNQSVEGLESKYKHEADAPLPICRHFSIPDHCDTEPQDDDSNSSDDDLIDMCNWYKNVSSFRKLAPNEPPKNQGVIAGIVKKGENLLAKKSSYDVADVTLRNSDCMKTERKIPEVDVRRFNIDYLTKSPIMAEGVKNIPKTFEVQNKPTEKTNFFTKKLLSPKLSRLFKPNTTEVVRNKPEIDENKEEKLEKSRSKFFIQRPASPSNICRSSYKIRPMDDSDRKLHTNKPESNLLKSDLKLASMGKPMTPIFRRHNPNERPDFADGRFSYRDRRPKYEVKANQEPKFVDVGRNRIKAPINSIEKTKLAPLIRSSQSNNIPALATVPEKKLNVEASILKRREPGISRSNYVSLANLKINSKKDLEKTVDKSRDAMSDTSPVERVI